ncbi:MAG: AbrB/MazE/SpoVT family DNA-binding domain-containing protein [Betaproteobacteria bacterium]|nr:AbrB/MazE/SpoVT family DNA-binding domain-containing protein [Betaproteobacteria bacterium]
MEISIRKLGNSAGIILPATLMRALGLSIGTAVTAEQVEGKLVLTPAVKKRYTAAELNAQCNPRAPMPEDIVAWDRAPAVGTEAL